MFFGYKVISYDDIIDSTMVNYGKFQYHSK